MWSAFTCKNLRVLNSLFQGDYECYLGPLIYFPTNMSGCLFHILLTALFLVSQGDERHVERGAVPVLLGPVYRPTHVPEREDRVRVRSLPGRGQEVRSLRRRKLEDGSVGKVALSGHLKI